MSESKHVYAFAGGGAEGRAHQKQLLGGKGAGLAEMSRLGIPVPPGFTLTTEVCTVTTRPRRRLSDGLREEVAEHLRRVEEQLGQRFGDAGTRCWSRCAPARRCSMPGMMDTVLNLGLNDALGRRRGSRAESTPASSSTPTGGS